mgnify:CR=1 FL=1
MIIYNADGILTDIEDHKLTCLGYNIPSPQITYERESADGQDGDVIIDAKYENRSIAVEFLYKASDIVEFHYIKSIIYRLFAKKDPFYITFRKEPARRWLVRLDTSFELVPTTPNVGSFTVYFISSSPFAESLGSTLNPSDYFQIRSSDPVEYAFNHSSFSVWNDGDASIDPRQHYLKIEYKGASTNLVIRNLTNGTEWRYNGSSSSSDIFVLDGVKSFKNGFSVFGNTNRKLIKLEPGLNDFELFGVAEPFEISFDFRFLYI